ncbi:MAG: RNHCP domain-containing protein [Candidatus Moraniibacteriota bacterium]|nr:MAG: RNHCP domain-containing protein [Candidatus Moranbacteria bacterium]
MSSSRFQKHIESFACGHCGAFVEGNGYTNHCPRCLWSRHVDIFPGDRAAACGELMAPVSAWLEHGEWQLRHRCLACGYEKKNRLSADDDMSVLADIVRGGKK